jgi:short-subunit dehydrogenase
MTTLPQNTALITGASSGIGATFARHLARQQYNLILVARRQERMEALANEIRQQSPVKIDVFPVDLSVPTEVARVEQCIQACDTLDLLVNNAGFGVPGPFIKANINQHLDMIAVHVTASVRLSRAALPGMIARKHGHIINVSSVAAFIPSQGNPTYAATKAYLNAFSESLSTELRRTGVTVQALCPGFTITEFHDAPAYQQKSFRSRTPKLIWLQPDEVVSASLKALKSKRVYCIPGYKYRLVAFMGRIGLATLLADVFLRYFRKPE